MAVVDIGLEIMIIVQILTRIPWSVAPFWETLCRLPHVFAKKRPHLCIERKLGFAGSVAASLPEYAAPRCRSGRQQPTAEKYVIQCHPNQPDMPPNRPYGALRVSIGLGRLPWLRRSIHIRRLTSCNSRSLIFPLKPRYLHIWFLDLGPYTLSEFLTKPEPKS